MPKPTLKVEPWGKKKKKKERKNHRTSAGERYCPFELSGNCTDLGQ